MPDDQKTLDLQPPPPPLKVARKRRPSADPLGRKPLLRARQKGTRRDKPETLAASSARIQALRAAETPEQSAQRHAKRIATLRASYDRSLRALGFEGLERELQHRLTEIYRRGLPRSRARLKVAAAWKTFGARRARLTEILTEEGAMTNHHPSLGYEVKRVMIAGTPRTVARFTCHTCPQHLDFTISDGNNPERLVRQARSAGWEADIQTARLTRCPTCIDARAFARKGDKPMNGNGAHPPAAKPAAPAAAPAAAAPLSTAQAAAAAVVAETPRELSVAEKRIIRRLFDEHFDEDLGRYLEGKTDQWIAEQVRVPRASVAALREAAFGPLKGDDELDDVRKDLAAAKAQVLAIEHRIEAIERRMGMRK